MPMQKTTPITLIAACGINCGVCRAHLRVSNPCPGCRADDRGKPKTRVRCRLKTCAKRSGGRAGYCFACDEFPCADLVRLDNRYRVRYGVSPIDNLLSIQRGGAEHSSGTKRRSGPALPARPSCACMNRNALPAGMPGGHKAVSYQPSARTFARSNVAVDSYWQLNTEHW